MKEERTLKEDRYCGDGFGYGYGYKENVEIIKN
jgi:hypothetical protein